MIVFGFLSVWSLYVITGKILLDVVQWPTHYSTGQNYVGQKEILCMGFIKGVLGILIITPFAL